MKKLFQILIIIFILNVGFFAQERTWTTYSPLTGEWSVLAPGIMTPDSEALKTGSNKGSYTFNDYNGFFAVIYRDTPRRYVPWKPNYKAYYKKIRKDAMKAATGELIKDEEYTNGTIKGREVQIKIPNRKTATREGGVKTTYRIERFRMFFHEKRFYLVLAVLPEGEINTPAVDNYLNSFVVK